MSGKGKPWAVSLANAVKMMRALSGMGLREYARHIRINPATLSRIERGYGCDLDKLVTIHKATKVSYEVLLDDCCTDAKWRVNKARDLTRFQKAHGRQEK